MYQRMYLFISGGVFGIVALFHLLRVVRCWPVVLGSWSAPLWLSWLGIVGPSFLCIWALRLAMRSGRS